MVDAQVHVVIDIGSGYTKIGFSGEEEPEIEFPTSNIPDSKKYSRINKNSPFQSVINPSSNKNPSNSNNLQNLNSISIDNNNNNTLKLPQSYSSSLYDNSGFISNFDAFEKLIDKIYTEKLPTISSNSSISSKDHNVILTDPPKNDETNRVKMAEIMFEKFEVPALFISMTSLMAIYSTGRSIGIVVDSGEERTHFVPVYEGFAFSNIIETQNIGGKTLTNHLMNLFNSKGKINYTNRQFGEVDFIKENYCFVSYDFYENNKGKGGINMMKNNKESGVISGQNKEVFVDYLPDGKKIEFEMDYEQQRCPNVLFSPGELNAKNINITKGIHDECNLCIQKCDVEIRKDLYSNIVLSGGNTLFQGLPERLTKEVQRLTPSAASNKVKVIALPERKFATWIGANILSGLSNFQCMWITKEDYKEGGEGKGGDVIKRKCFF